MSSCSELISFIFERASWWNLARIAFILGLPIEGKLAGSACWGFLVQTLKTKPPFTPAVRTLLSRGGQIDLICAELDFLFGLPIEGKLARSAR